MEEEGRRTMKNPGLKGKSTCRLEFVTSRKTDQIPGEKAAREKG
jgi:hypothetical protein